MTVQPSTVIYNVLSTLYQHAWNTRAAQKTHSGAYVTSGGLWINWERQINWQNFSTIWDVNDPLGVNQTQRDAGQTEVVNHDPQVCLAYLSAVAGYKAQFPNDTSFDKPNAAGFMGVSQFVDHICNQTTNAPYGDFKPALGASNFGGYSNPKGWVYFALLQSYLNLQNSSLLTAQQVTNLKQAVLYQAWTYYNTYYQCSGGTCNIVPVPVVNYACSQAMLCAAALLDACHRFSAADITNTGTLFYPNAAQSVSTWQTAAINTIQTVINNGAYNTSQGLWYALMNINLSGGLDTPTNNQAKVEQNSEVIEGLARCSVLLTTLNPTLSTQCANLAATTIQNVWNRIWDPVYGGFFFDWDMGTQTVGNGYKETRSTALFLRAVHYYNQYIANSFADYELKAVTALCNLFYQSTYSYGFLYRLAPNGSIYVNLNVTQFAQTLASKALAGAQSITLSSITSTVDNLTLLTANTDYQFVIDPGVPGVEEMLIFNTDSTPTTTLTTPTGIPLAHTHQAGAIVATVPPYSMPAYKYKNNETQPTTEAMGNVVRDLLFAYTTIPDVLPPPPPPPPLPGPPPPVTQIIPQSDGSSVTTGGTPLYSDGGPEIERMGVRRPSLLQMFEMDIEDLVQWFLDFF